MLPAVLPAVWPPASCVPAVLLPAVLVAVLALVFGPFAKQVALRYAGRRDPDS